MKTLCTCVQALLLCAFTLFAQSTVTVTDSIIDGANQGVTGSCTYRLASGRALAGSGAQIVGEPVTVRFSAGVFSAAIVPTPAEHYYSVSCSGSRGWSKTGAWIVPASGPVTLNDIWVNVPPAPPITFLPLQINVTGLTNGTQYCIVPVSGVATLVACTGGGGGSFPATWSAMTSAWSSYASSWSSYQ